MPERGLGVFVRIKDGELPELDDLMQKLVELKRENKAGKSFRINSGLEQLMKDRIISEKVYDAIKKWKDDIFLTKELNTGLCSPNEMFSLLMLWNAGMKLDSLVKNSCKEGRQLSQEEITDIELLLLAAAKKRNKDQEELILISKNVKILELLLRSTFL